MQNKFDELLGLVGDDNKDRATTLVKEINDDYAAKISGLDSEIKQGESKLNEAIKTRDKAKAALRESVSEDVKDKEIINLKSEIEALNIKLKDSDVKHNQEMLKLSVQKDIASLLPKYKVKANAVDYVTRNILEKANYQDGKVTFKDLDGTTLRTDGRDSNIEDMIKEMQIKEIESKESMFFNLNLERSGVTSNKGGKVTTEDFIPGQ